MPDTRADLLALLAARPGLAQHELAGRIGVSTRTARRHLDTLARAGDVVVTTDGPTRRYRLADHAQPAVGLPVLTEAEVEALSVAALAARSVLAPTPLAGPLDAAAEKLRRAGLADVTTFESDMEPGLWDFEEPAGPPEPFDPDAFRALLVAVRTRTPVLADYYTASRQALSTGRRLHPLGFLVRAGAWLLIAHDPARVATLDFALGGFRAVRPGGTEPFDLPSGFDLHLHARDRFRALAGAEAYVVRFLVEPEAAPYFERRAYVQTQQIEENRPDGRLVVSFDVEGLDDVAAWALSWGPKVRVLEPPTLVERVVEAHRKAIACYEMTHQLMPYGSD